MKRFFVTALLMGSVACYSVAQVSDSTATATTGSSMTMDNEVSSESKQFMEKATTSGKLEVELGKMAQEKASAQEVKDFGQRMVTDHGKANEDLKALAQEKNVTLPDSLTAKQQRTVDKLSGLSGEEFDQEYMKTMVKDHNKDINTFQKASENLTDPAVKEFASKTLPVLKEHQQMAKQINGQLSNL